MSKANEKHKPVDTGLFDTLVPILDLIDTNRPTEALALLDAIAMPTDLKKPKDIQMFFQVSIERLRCYTKLGMLPEAKAVADQLIAVDRSALTEMKNNLWLSGFVVSLLQFMRLTDKFNFMSLPALKPYRDYIEANQDLDEHSKGVTIYGLYKLGVDMAAQIRSMKPKEAPFVATLDAMTPEAIQLLVAGHSSLMDYIGQTLTLYGKICKKDQATIDRIATLNTTLAAQPRS
jgi:hypothetical protein